MTHRLLRPSMRCQTLSNHCLSREKGHQSPPLLWIWTLLKYWNPKCKKLHELFIHVCCDAKQRTDYNCLEKNWWRTELFVWFSFQVIRNHENFIQNQPKLSIILLSFSLSLPAFPLPCVFEAWSCSEGLYECTVSPLCLSVVF